MAFNGLFKGHMVSFSACEVRVLGVRYVGFTKADVDDGMKAEKEYGSGPIALGAAIGTHEAMVTLEQHYSEAQALMKALNNAAGGAGYAFAFANISFTFAGVPGVQIPLQTIEVKQVRFLHGKSSKSNDGRASIWQWDQILVTQPIAFNGIYSINPEVFTPSNSVNTGLGGEVITGG